MKSDILSTFQLVYQDKVISPILTTIRMYGDWFEDVFDEYTAQTELYLKSRKKDGTSVLEWHPGTRIGHWFDTKLPRGSEYQSWFILQNSSVMDRLVKLKQAEYKDAIPISANDSDGRRMLRVYTANQIELYIRSNLDKKFEMAKYISESKQIKVKDSEISTLIMPDMQPRRRKLF